MDHQAEMDKMFIEELEAAIGKAQIENLPQELHVEYVAVPDLTRWWYSEQDRI